MINYINVSLTVNNDTEIERAVRFLSGICSEAYVVCTKSYNPWWCTVDVRLEDYDEDGPYEIGHAVIYVMRKDTPLLRELVDHVLGCTYWDYDELRVRAEAYECLERDDEEARMQEEFRQLSYENDYVPSLHA